MSKKATQNDVQFEYEFSLFKRACNKSQYPVLTILRVHLLTEYYLERLIHVVLPRSDHVIDEGNLTYYQKLVLVKSFDIVEDRILQSLKNLNRIRNRCAHEVELIARPLGKTCTQFRREFKKSVKLFLFSALSYVCGYMARGVVEAETQRLKAKPQKETENK